MTDDLTLNMNAYLPLRDVVFNTLRDRGCTRSGQKGSCKIYSGRGIIWKKHRRYDRGRIGCEGAVSRSSEQRQL